MELPGGAGNLNKTFLLSDWTYKKKKKNCSSTVRTSAGVVLNIPLSAAQSSAVRTQPFISLNIAGGEGNTAQTALDLSNVAACHKLPLA